MHEFVSTTIGKAIISQHAPFIVDPVIGAPSRDKFQWLRRTITPTTFVPFSFALVFVWSKNFNGEASLYVRSYQAVNTKYEDT
jgi:hypothetical protein